MSSTDAVIREISHEFIDQAVLLWEKTGLTRPWNDAHADASLALATSTSTILGVVAGERLRGTAIVGFDGHRGWLYYLAVDPDFQGAGWGEKLVKAAEEWLRSHDAVKLQLMVRTDNDSVVNFYSALGFEPADVLVLGKRLYAASS